MTLCAPLVGALIMNIAVPQVRDWLIWDRAHRTHETLYAALHDARKKLDAERSSLRQQLATLDAQQGSWQAHHRAVSRAGPRPWRTTESAMVSSP